MDQLDPKTTALVVIDLQKPIVAMPLAPHSGPDVVKRTSDLARAVRAGGGMVAQVRVRFHDGKEALNQPSDEPSMSRSMASLPADFFEFAPDLSVEDADLQIVKKQWGAVYGTDLDLQLRRRGVTTVILCGVATNFGVESTARDLWELNYALVFAEDAISSRSEELHRFPIQHIFPRLGRVASTADVLTALKAA
jgi:nicotinamidase-related amidase